MNQKTESGAAHKLIPPCSALELAAVERLRADYTAMAGEICGGCNRPMAYAQPFYVLGTVPRQYTCFTCALIHIRSSAS